MSQIRGDAGYVPDDDLPGDPVCLLRRVCQQCGAVADEDPPTTCPQCHADMPADLGHAADRSGSARRSEAFARPSALRSGAGVLIAPGHSHASQPDSVSLTLALVKASAACTGS
jgi:hypothetical protein